MSVATFGFATPLDFNVLEKGMLVVAAPAQDQSYFGVVTKFRHEFVLVVLASTDGEVPGPLELSSCTGALWRVPGVLEIEPAGQPFVRGPTSSPPTGFLVGNAGHLLASFLHRNDNGQKERFTIDLTTGEHSQEPGRPVMNGLTIFIRQEGRRERFELVF